MLYEVITDMKMKKKNNEEIMLQIEDTIVSLDLLEEKFVCDLASCKGICCVEGDDA